MTTALAVSGLLLNLLVLAGHRRVSPFSHPGDPVALGMLAWVPVVAARGGTLGVAMVLAGRAADGWGGAGLAGALHVVLSAVSLAAWNRLLSPSPAATRGAKAAAAGIFFGIPALAGAGTLACTWTLSGAPS